MLRSAIHVEFIDMNKSDLTHVFVSIKTIGLSVQKGRKPQTLEDALKHNLRLIKVEESTAYNPTLSSRNQLLCDIDSPQKGRAKLNKLFELYALSPKRRDYVQAIEMLFTVSSKETRDKVLSYFEASYSWVQSYYGKGLVINAVIHLDENEPHLHILIAPLYKSESGYRLAGSVMNREHERRKAKTAFNAEVAKRFGFHVETFAEYQDDKRTRGDLATQIINHLIAIEAPETKGRFWGLTQLQIKRNPKTYARALGLSEHPSIGALAASTKKRITSENGYSAKSLKVPHAFETKPQKAVTEAKSILCIDFDKPTPVNVEVIRVRESEMNAALFDPETGEFHTPPKLAGNNRAAADSWVKDALKKCG